MPKEMTTLAAMNLINEVISEDINEDDKPLLIADRLAIRNGKILSPNEMTNLVNQLLQCDNPEFLPMNERVFLRLDNTFLNKFFF